MKDDDLGQERTLSGILAKGDEEEKMNWKVIEQTEPYNLVMN